jgi:hypothetical protein
MRNCVKYIWKSRKDHMFFCGQLFFKTKIQGYFFENLSNLDQPRNLNLIRLMIISK